MSFAQGGILPINTGPMVSHVLPGVTMLGGETYQADIELTISGLPAVLDLLKVNEAPLMILDGNGGVLGVVTSDSLLTNLLEALAGVTATLDIQGSHGGVIGQVSLASLIEVIAGESSTLEILDLSGNVLGIAQAGGLLDGLLDNLLGGLLGGAGLMDLVDSGGTVLGRLPVDEVTDLLDGVTGDLTVIVELLTETLGGTVIDPVLELLDTPIIRLGNTMVTAVQPPASSPAPAPVANAPTLENSRPFVRVTKRKRRGSKFIMKGTATDLDGRIRRVKVLLNGDRQRVRGNAVWKVRLKLEEGRNKIVIRAIDEENAVSRPKRMRRRG